MHKGNVTLTATMVCNLPLSHGAILGIRKEEKLLIWEKCPNIGYAFSSDYI